MNKKILIASIFATLMLLVPMTSVVGVSDVGLNRMIENIEDNNTIIETYDNEDCGCQVVYKYDLLRVKLLVIRIKVFTNILLLRFGNIPEIKEKCLEILNVLNSDRPICDIIITTMLILAYIGLELHNILSEDYPGLYVIIVMPIVLTSESLLITAFILGCPIDDIIPDIP